MGFTLAEVLITLGIIGIVAAITMPTLIANHKKKVAANQLKTAYSILSQAITSSISENGEMYDWDFSLSNTNFAQKYILPYLKVGQTVTQNSGSYWAVKVLMSGGYPYFTWPSSESKLEANPIYILPNGSAINIARFLDLRTEIVIDINGPKAPNKLGVDGFVFYLNPSSNRLYPRGIEYTLNKNFNYTRDDLLNEKSGGYACSRTINTGHYYQGAYCAAVIMLDGWKITKDYPWGN